MHASDASPELMPGNRSVQSTLLAKPSSMRREARWKRRKKVSWHYRIYTMIIVPIGIFAFIAIMQINALTENNGPAGKSAKIVFNIFPEANPQRIEVTNKDNLLNMVTLHLPSHMIERSRGINNPIENLSDEFGGSKIRLSAVEITDRIEQIVAALLPDGMVKCYTYHVGAVSSPPEASRPTRSLYLYFNPGC